MRKTTVANVFIRASKILEKKGWIRHYFENDKGACCLAGALDKAGGDRVPGLWQRCTQYLTQVTDPKTGFVDWNDNKCKSKTQAISKLKQAAALALKEE